MAPDRDDVRDDSREDQQPHKEEISTVEVTVDGPGTLAIEPDEVKVCNKIDKGNDQQSLQKGSCGNCHHYLGGKRGEEQYV